MLKMKVFIEKARIAFMIHPDLIHGNMTVFFS